MRIHDDKWIGSFVDCNDADKAEAGLFHTNDWNIQMPRDSDITKLKSQLL